MRVRIPFAIMMFAGIAPLHAADLPRLLESPAVLGAARSVEPSSEINDSAILPVTNREPERISSGPVRLSPPAGAKPISADFLNDRDPESPRRTPVDYEPDDELDFVSSRSELGNSDRSNRSRSNFGDKLKDWLAPGGGRDTWLFSDHAFDHFATPITNPFLAEDPRALTEIRPIFIYQNIPSPQPNFQGGNAFFFGGRASIALSERFSFTINKLGAIAASAKNKSFMDDEFGFAELWLGPKFTFYRDPANCAVIATGLLFQIPTGPEKVFQNTGSLSIAPYVSAGKTLGEWRDFGTFNGILSTGYAFSTNSERSEYFYGSAHLDFDIRNRNRFYPVAELNWFQYTKSGSVQTVSGHGHDLFNFGSQSRNASLLTGAVGARYKITEAAQIGGAFELPLFGNKDIFQYRFTFDVIFRY